MRRVVLLSVLALTVVGCGVNREMDNVKQAVSDTATVPKDDVSCSKRAERRYDCTTRDGVFAVRVKYDEFGKDMTTYHIEGSDFPR